MTHFTKHRLPFAIKWISSKFYENCIASSKSQLGFIGWWFHTIQKPNHYGTKALAQNPVAASKVSCKSQSKSNEKEAQAALLEYLHSTRSLLFLDADHMSKNSSVFVKKLLKKVENEEDIRRSITRFLRYHPINEFEPFFESVGLKYSEYASLLPRDLIFLSDDELLLENYHVLCDYGIARNKIGKIFKEAYEVFRYDSGLLQSKLRAYEELLPDRSSLSTFVTASPRLLIGDINVKFSKVLEKFNYLGFSVGWIEEQLMEESSYNWNQILELLRLFGEIGFSDEMLTKLISQHPDLLFENSGSRTFSLVGLLFKFGLSKRQLCSILLQFPQIQVGKFLLNLRNCLLFLDEIEMELPEIRKLVHSEALFLGSCMLKKANSLLNNLNVGKKRLCRLIQENPKEMANWVLGARVDPLPNSGEDEKSRRQKIEFLVSLGFAENSLDMEKALKLFRGKGVELQERLICIVQAGLDLEDVYEIVKTSPQILNQKKSVIKMKLDFLVYEMGYPISSLMNFPSYLSYTTQRVNLRLSMYNWLKDRGAVEPGLALSTLVACSDKIFIGQYVKHHPSGPQVWQDLKERIYSER